MVALALLGASAAYALTRPSGDIELGGGYATRAWDGTRVVDPQEIGQATRFAGNGTVVAIVMAENLRDHAVKIAVPARERARLAASGVRASVAFVPRGRVILNDGHDARVDTSYEESKGELLPYADEAIDVFEALRIEGC